MINSDDITKQLKDMTNILSDMEKAHARDINNIQSMEGYELVADKMDALKVFMKNGNIKGILKIQDELMKMHKESK